MKKHLCIVTCLLLSYYSYSQVNASDFGKLKWLEGEWNRTNVKPGRSGHERWVSVSDKEWKGWGITMKGNDTAFVEKLKIIIKGDKIFYVADTPENKEPVYFTVTRISDNSFECENPAHDFPKKIAYYREGNSIKATISGDGKAIDYMFEKK